MTTQTSTQTVPNFDTPVLPSDNDVLFVSLSAADEDGGFDRDFDWDDAVATERYFLDGDPDVLTRRRFSLDYGSGD